MSVTLKRVELASFANGAISELFNEELQRVLENISDINTDPEMKRGITINFEFKPGPKRDVAAVSVKCTSKLASLLKVNTALFIGKKDGELIAVENYPRQGQLFDQPEAAPAKPLAPVSNINQGRQG